MFRPDSDFEHGRPVTILRIPTEEIISAKKGKTGSRLFLVNVNVLRCTDDSDRFTGEYSVEIVAHADRKRLVAHLSTALLYWPLVFLVDYLLVYIIQVTLSILLAVHFLCTLCFPWVMYRQVFYDEPRSRGRSRKVLAFVLRRPIIDPSHSAHFLCSG